MMAVDIESKSSGVPLASSTTPSSYGSFVAGAQVVTPSGRRAPCCGAEFAYEELLTPADRRRLDKLRTELAIPYNSDEEKHEVRSCRGEHLSLALSPVVIFTAQELLYSLWRLSFPDEELSGRKTVRTDGQPDWAST